MYVQILYSFKTKLLSLFQAILCLTMSPGVNTTYSLFYPEDGDDNSLKCWYLSIKLQDVVSHKAELSILIYIPNIPFLNLQLTLFKSAFRIYAVPGVFHVLLKINWDYFLSTINHQIFILEVQRIILKITCIYFIHFKPTLHSMQFGRRAKQPVHHCHPPENCTKNHTKSQPYKHTWAAF